MDKEPTNGVALEEAYQIVGVVILFFCFLPHNNSRNFIGDKVRKVKGAAVTSRMPITRVKTPINNYYTFLPFY